MNSIFKNGITRFPASALTYNDEIDDGVGAQLHRIIGIYTLSVLYRIPYRHTGIKNLLITALDPYQTQKELDVYIRRINEIFELPSSDFGSQRDYKFELPSPTKLNLNLIRLKNRLRIGKFRTFVISNPFVILNKNPDAYLLAIPQLPMAENIKRDFVNIVVHYRRGSSSFDILPGESAPRAILNEWYLKVLNKYVDQLKADKIKYHIDLFTDMPKHNLDFAPIAFQRDFWKQLPRFEKEMITIHGEDLNQTTFRDFGDSLTVHYGGDPLNDLMHMAEADLLIMSRSSFSFVGALLNRNGKIIVPPNFGHNNLSSWITED
jgi:hypothetical protein